MKSDPPAFFFSQWLSDRDCRAWAFLSRRKSLALVRDTRRKGSPAGSDVGGPTGGRARLSAGGQGPMFTFSRGRRSICNLNRSRVLRGSVAKGSPVRLLCHLALAVPVLRYARLSFFFYFFFF